MHHDADCVVRASEDWATQYTQDKKSFALVVYAERQMKAKLQTYFRELAKRAPRMIDWHEYQQQAIKAYDVVVGLDDSDFEGEYNILIDIMFDDMGNIATNALAAAEATYGKGIITDQAKRNMLQAIQDYIANQVRDITETTRNDIKASIETSIKQGESINEATSRLDSILGDSNRSELIARTESVKAYNQGILEYGNQSGAETKTWHALPDAIDELCTGNDEQTVNIDDEFDSGDDAPPAHPNCRCGMSLNYPDGNSDQTDSEE